PGGRPQPENRRDPGDESGRVHGEDRRRSQDPGYVISFRESGICRFPEFLQGPACTPLAYTCPLRSAKSHAQVAAFCEFMKVRATSPLARSSTINTFQSRNPPKAAPLGDFFIVYSIFS